MPRHTIYICIYKEAPLCQGLHEQVIHNAIKILMNDTFFRTHTGERPHVCTYQNCSRAFVSSSNLRKHEKTMHNRLHVSTYYKHRKEPQIPTLKEH